MCLLETPRDMTILYRETDDFVSHDSSRGPGQLKKKTPEGVCCSVRPDNSYGSLKVTRLSTG